ncbi:hypothetical protein LJD17_05365 [Microvirga rosea]|nr:hypothetical protein [Microvirga rosea]
MEQAQPRHPLPLSLPPRGLSRVEAAALIGVSPAMFDIMVKDARMPRPKRIGSRVVWDRLKIESSFAALPDGDEDGGHNPFDDTEL